MASATNISVETFVGLVKQCGLIDGELLKKHLKEMKESGPPLDDPQSIADEFVKRNLLTRWQADKLLQGRHKGFFLGKYRLLSLLGAGGMSSVYLAEHVLMRRRVAIKVLPKQRVEDSSYLERFHREAQAVAALDHRNIVRAYDVDQEKNIHFLVMEYVPGQSLHELVTRQGKVDFVPAAEYIRQAAEGLHHAHRMGMVHRDIKPGNLLLDEKGTIKLLDLGLARFFDDKEEHSLTVKHDEKVLGTADYLSPEQALNSHTVDLRSDIYSMGCTLYFLLTGHPPFPEGTLAQRLLSHQSKTPAPLMVERPDAPPGLAAILEKMMAKNADSRYQTAKDAALALLEWLTECGGETWAGMNPQGIGNSQIIGNQSPPGSSIQQVLDGDPPGSGQLLPAGTAVGSVSETVGPGGSDSDGFLMNPFAGNAAQPDRENLAGDSSDTEMAALFSEIATEKSSSISQSSLKRKRSGTKSEKIPVEKTPVSPPEEPSWLETAQVEAPPAAALPQSTAQAADFRFEETVPFESPPLEDPFQLLASVSATTVVPPTASSAEVPIAKPSRKQPAQRPAQRNAAKPQMNRPLIFGVGGVLLLVLAATVYFVAFRGSGSTGKIEEGDKPVKPKPGGTSKEPKVSEEKTADFRGEFTLGPVGRFKTIRELLAELKKLKNNKSLKAVQIVKVAAGQTFAERIVIDDSFPRGIQFIAEPGPPPVLAPLGTEPVIILRSTNGKVENFHLEGFRIDATGKDTAVEISDWAPGAQLKRLEIFGFNSTGVHFHGAQTYGKEDERIILQESTVRSSNPAGVGVRISRKADDSAFVRINQCRFFGPLDCGILLEANSRGIEISETILDKAVTGIKFQGEDRNWNDILIGFNTFYQNDRAIVFTNMPASRSRDLQFHNNLFVDSKSADVVVEKDYKPSDFFLMYRTFPGGSSYNWTTRPTSDSARTDELSTLFETATAGSKRGVGDLQFVSTDPENPEFLAPTPTAPQKNTGTLSDVKRFGTQIGAVRPK
jgi:serine/threonine-protein kinase